MVGVELNSSLTMGNLERSNANSQRSSSTQRDDNKINIEKPL